MDILNNEASKIGIERKRPTLEKIEFRYVANFLGMKPNKAFYENNNILIDKLVSHRINRYKSSIDQIKVKFEERFKD
ncbi:MAG: hypothetical protein ACJ0HV_04845 [Candidatus Pseudothioglobus sp.]